MIAVKSLKVCVTTADLGKIACLWSGLASQRYPNITSCIRTPSNRECSSRVCCVWPQRAAWTWTSSIGCDQIGQAESTQAAEDMRLVAITSSVVTALKYFYRMIKRLSVKWRLDWTATLQSFQACFHPPKLALRSDSLIYEDFQLFCQWMMNFLDRLPYIKSFCGEALNSSSIKDSQSFLEASSHCLRVSAASSLSISCIESVKGLIVSVLCCGGNILPRGRHFIWAAEQAQPLIHLNWTWKERKGLLKAYLYESNLRRKASSPPPPPESAVKSRQGKDCARARGPSHVPNSSIASPSHFWRGTFWISPFLPAFACVRARACVRACVRATIWHLQIWHWPARMPKAGMPERPYDSVNTPTETTLETRPTFLLLYALSIKSKIIRIIATHARAQ